MPFRIEQLNVLNLATVGNSITAGSFVKSGGTSSQFLKADGSVDSSAYITGITSGMVTTALGYTPVPNTRTLTINGTSYDLTADRSWTISVPVSSVSGSGAGISVSPTTGAVVVSNTGVTSNVAGTGISVSGATGAVTITNTGVTSIVAGTAISISGATGAVTINNTGVTSLNGGTGAITGIATTAQLAGYLPLSGGTITGTLGVISDFSVNNTRFTVNAATGNTVAAGSFTANSIIKSGGTSFQFLKADGSIDSNSYITSASVGNGTLTLNVSGNGLSGSQTFTANQSTAATFTVTSNATTAATANTLVYRDGSGHITGNYGFFAYVNTSDNDETGITRFVIKNGDNYHRSATTTTAMTVIRGVASGTWGIDITGTAGSETLATVTGRGASTSTFSTFSGGASVSSGALYFRGSSTEYIIGEAWATGYYGYNNNDGFLFYQRDVSNNPHPTFHIGGNNNASYGGWSTADGMITLVRGDGTKQSGTTYAYRGLSDSAYYTNIVKTTSATVFKDAQGLHQFSGNVDATNGSSYIRVSGISSGSYIEISGNLPGYSNGVYPVIKSGGTIHFANNNKYSAYLEGANTYFGILDNTTTTRVFLTTSGTTYFTGGNVAIGNTSASFGLHVNRNQNQVAGFESPNVNTWVDIISTTRTWSIGSTASSTFAVYDRGSNVTRIEVDTGSNLYAYGSMRAPIFYDSDNTTYYGNFAGMSNIYSLQAANDITSSGGQGRFGGWYTGTAYTGVAVEVGISSGNGYVIAYNRNTSAYTNLELNGVNIYLYQQGGLVWTNSQLVRNVAGVGWLSGNYASSETSSTTGAIYSIGGSYYPTSTSLNTMYGIGYTHTNQGGMISGASGWGLYVVSGGTVKVWLGADNGNIIASGNIYMGTSSLVATQSWVNSQGFATGGPFVPVSGGINMTGSYGLNDNKLYLRTNGDNNHYLWNAGDDWEELNAYEGTGFRITSVGGSVGVLYVYGSSNGGYTYSPYSFRAPIFYDSDNTAYYGNFASFSYFNQLGIADWQYIGGQTSNGQSNYQWEGATYRNPGDWTARLIVRRDNASTGINGAIPSLVLFNNNGSDQTTVSMVFATNECSSGSNSVNLAGIIAKKEAAGTCGGWSPGSLTFFVKDYGTRRDALYLDTSGYVSTPYSFRAPIFYDSDNTSYYLDPSSTTSLRTVGSWRSDSSAWDGEFSGKIQYHSNHWYIQGADLLIFRNSGGSNVFTVNQSGTAQASSDFRAPIFYDSANTSYYCDPASTSVLNTISSYTIYNTSLGSGYYFTAGDWGWRHQTPSGWIQFGPANTGHAHIYTDRSNFYFNVDVMYQNGNRIYGDNYRPYADSAGNASAINGISVNQIFNNMGNNHSTYTNFNNIPNFGVYYVQGTTSGPGTGSSQFYGFTLGLGNEYAYASYALQLAIPRDNGSDRYLSTRTREGGSWGSWYKINAGYSDSAGNADTVDGFHAAAFPYRSGGSSGYYQVADWMQFNTTAGLYWPSYNGAHIYPNTSTSYGSIRIDGSRSGWRGITFDGSVTLMMNDNESGHYKDGYGWQFRWYAGQLYASRGTYGGSTEYVVLDSGNYNSYSPTLTGGGASGTWSINITGNAASASSVAWSNVSSKPANWLNTTNLIDDYAPQGTAVPSGFYQDYNGSGNPTGTWFNYINVRHSNPGNGHGYQIGMSYYDSNLWFRSYQGGTSPSFASWSRALGTVTDPYPSNMNQYVRTTDSPTFSAVYASNWFRAYGDTGLYSQDYGSHIRRTVNASHGTWEIFGYSKGGYNGLNIQDPQGYYNNYMHESGNGGLYQQNGYGWIFYWYRPNSCLGIGTSTTSGSYRMYVNGGIYSTGDVVAYSDRRKKTDIVTIDNALEKVTNLRGVFYTKIGEEEKGRKTGVIAQEINEVLPEVVTYAADVDEYGVAYGNIAGVLIEAIKEQNELIKTLKSEIDELKARLN